MLILAIASNHPFLNSIRIAISDRAKIKKGVAPITNIYGPTKLFSLAPILRIKNVSQLGCPVYMV